jgi:hypothetical protein
VSTSSHRVAILAFLLVGVVAVGAGAQTSPEETSSEVPALAAFHEVIYPLWHEAWPARNLGLVRELWPQVEQGVAAIDSAELPGILRDKRDAWRQGVAALKAAAGRLKATLDVAQEKETLDAVEELHARFEQLARLTHPVMKELDAYHVVLYELYHKLRPVTDLTTIAAASQRLAESCSALMAAPVPRRFMDRQAELSRGFSELCDATAALRIAASGEDAAAVEAAVERVHTQYQSTEALFR